MKRPVIAALAVMTAGLAWAQVLTLPVPLSLDHRDWKPVVNLPPGAEYAVLAEDPVTHGVEALVQFPRSYKVPQHFHSHLERILLVKGRLRLESPGHSPWLVAGDMMTLPAGTPHGMSTGFWRGAVFYVKTDKPFDFHAADAAQ